jgi:hypothetical protein
MDTESGVKRAQEGRSTTIKNDFKEYLKHFVSTILADNPTILKEFCNIDIDDYNIDGDKLPFMIASLNGYHDLVGKKLEF